MVSGNDDPNVIKGRCNYCGKHDIIMRILKTRDYLIAGRSICDSCNHSRMDALMADMKANGYVWSDENDEWIEAEN